MERGEEQSERKFPEIDPLLKKKVEAIRCSKIEEMHQYYAFYHEIIWYGMEALLHVQFARDALEAAAGRKTLEELVAEYHLHKDIPSRFQFRASFKPLDDAGIYIAPQRKSREAELFSGDYMNLCGFPASLFRVPKATTQELLRRQWKLEDFQDKELMLKALWLSKNLWVITAMNFEMNKKEGRDREPLTPDIVETCRELLDYYWQIVEQPDDGEPPPGQWMVFRRIKNSKSIHENMPRVFMGKRSELREAMAQFPNAIEKSDQDPEVLRVLRKKTRRKLAQTLLAEKILDREEEM